MRTDQGQPILLSDYRPPDHLIETVELDIVLHRTATRVRSRLRIRPNPAGRADAPLRLDGDGLVPHAVWLEGTALPVTADLVTPDRLMLATPPRHAFTLEVETLLDPSANTQLMGLYRSGSAYCTQCEAEGFRRITYMLDRPDVLAVYTTRIEADRRDAPVLLGNGNCIEAGPCPDPDRHYAVWHDPFPKPCYLFALVGGALDCLSDSFTTASGRIVELGIYVEPGKTAQAVYAMDALKRSMRWDETAFGREYDLDVFNIVAVSDFNMGAMENKGLNVFNDKYILASPRTATDGDYAGIETVIAHEYFHNWTGNRITCRDWFQLCLKEGLTVFRDQEFSADERSRAVKRIADVRTLRLRQFTEDAGPLAHNVRPNRYVEINNFYTATIYEKGAEIIRMLRHLIGRTAFDQGMTLYFDRHDGTAATIEHFLSCFAEASGRDLTAFGRWYDQAGTPELRVSTQFDAASNSLVIDLAQITAPTPGQPSKGPMVIPIDFGLVDRNGAPVRLDGITADGLSEAELRSGVIAFDTPQRRIVLRGLDHPVVPSLLRGFSAPVRLVTDLSEADLATLLAHDSDSFNRWQAAQTLATRVLLDDTARMRRGEAAAPLPPSLTAAFAAVLDDPQADPAFVAQVLTLPGEADLARDLGQDVDPDALHAAREAMRLGLGRALGNSLRRHAAAPETAAPYSPASADAGRRALRNTALSLLAAGAPEEGQALAEARFAAADNMTDQLAALATACLVPGPGREDMLARFHASFADEPLVTDKWLALQASIPEPGTLDRVRHLMTHPAFSMGTPNRIYALIGGFAANQSQFNRRDGAGYAFLAEIVLVLDGKNPQVAARMLNAFRLWRTMESTRRTLAEAALRRITQQTSLSTDVGDILTRLLAN
ncbi:aminopeptidase N [Lichenihabitans sp. Uapishka_5]|uniref:aminopeptidase N n=1 Tax=Lichenihabitans sp. Uapishka_5 TaxID=3037302 RepID=UPI0029E80B68|nr:aminopeptidase N [Lichenihabitans sp. Uapishka_5]MDX7950374.1 aminopeptidase N [Lichenihabitans sp. Uapishka_5]